MRFIVIVLLFVIFGYSLGLVLFNNTEIAVNLIFSQAPAMNLGLLLILCIFLGVLIGMLVSLLLFKVIQNKWEINRLTKENKRLKQDLVKANVAIERQADEAPIVAKTAHGQAVQNANIVNKVTEDNQVDNKSL